MKTYKLFLIASFTFCSTMLTGCGQGSTESQNDIDPFVSVGDAQVPTAEQELLFAQGYYKRRRAVRTGPLPTATPMPTPVSTPWPTATPVSTPRPTATPVSTPRPTATPIPTPVPPVAGDCGSMNAVACETFHLINNERAKVGIAPLVANGTCIGAAQEQSDDMLARNYFSHDRPAFPDRPAETFAQRMNRWGLGYAGENIAYGYQSAAAAVSGWMNSPGHKANIMNANYRGTGVGFKNNYYTQCFTAY